MRETEIDEEGIIVLALFPLVQIVKHLLGVPRTAGFVRAAAFGSGPPDREFRVRGVITIPILAGPHRVITGAIKNSGHRVICQVGRYQIGVRRVGIAFELRFVGNVPNGPAGHDHVSRGRADAAGPRPHVIGTVQYHSLFRESIDDRRISVDAGL